MTRHTSPLVDHLRLTVLVELQALVEEAFPDDVAGDDWHYACERLLNLVQDRRRALLAGAPPLDVVESAVTEP